MIYSFELNEEDQKFVEAYTEETGESVGEIAKNALIEHIENIMDIRAAQEAWTEYQANPITYSLDEVRAMLGVY